MERIAMTKVQKAVQEKGILKGANLTVEEGEICALIGPNGVGKTTLLKCLLGLIFPDTGTIEINCEDLTDVDRFAWLSQIGAVMPYSDSLSTLTVRQLFTEHFQYIGIKNDNWYDLLKRVELEVRPDTKIGVLSLGMKQRLLLALALSHKPNILVLDEPFNGLDVDGIWLIKDILNDLKNDKVSILIASHSLSELEDIATSVVFMMNGYTYAKQSVENIKNEYVGGLHQYYQSVRKAMGYEQIFEF